MIDFSSAVESQVADGAQDDSAVWEFEIRDSYGLTPSQRDRVAAEVLEEHLEQSPELFLSHPSYANTVTVMVEGLRDRVALMESIGYDRLRFSKVESDLAELVTVRLLSTHLNRLSEGDLIAYLQLGQDLLKVPNADLRSIASQIAQVRYGRSLLELETDGKRIAGILLEIAELVKIEIDPVRHD